MTSFLFILAGVAFIGSSIWSVLDGRNRVKMTLGSTFREQRFSTPQGAVTGEFLRVVKIASDSMPFAYDNVWQLGPNGRRSAIR